MVKSNEKVDKYFEDESYISNSDLSLLKISPRLFYAKKSGKILSSNQDMDFGSAVHHYILETHSFFDKYVVFDGLKPESPQQTAAINYIAFSEDNIEIKDAYAKFYSCTGKSTQKIQAEAERLILPLMPYVNVLRQGKNILTSKEFDAIEGMYNDIMQHKRASYLLFGDNGYSEYPIFFEYNGLKFKSKLDRWILGDIIYIIDYKTTSDINNFGISFNKYDYGRQLACYTLALREELKRLKIPFASKNFEWKIIASDKQRSYECKVFDIPYEVINQGLARFDELVNKLIMHQKYGFERSIAYYEGNGEDVLTFD